MSWISLLYKTYNNLEKANITAKNELLPMAHSTQKAHVEITIDAEGNFIRAGFVKDTDGKNKSLSQTIIPVTEKSSGRSSGIAPHPLCDKLKYLALDYESYTGENNDEFFKEYLNNLRKWSNSEYSTLKVEAIYEYISKGTLIKDLIDNEIFSIDEKGMLTEKWEKTQEKLTEGKQKDAFIRFRVLDGSSVPAVWQDEILQKKYINYYMSTIENKGLCYVTGEIKNLSVNHPSKIRNSGDKAKLISSNDLSGFTYRGRFKNDTEAVQISYEVSQKAHNALKFLISNQGQVIGDKVFLLWGTKNEDLPKLNSDSYDFCNDNEDLSEYADIKSELAKKFKNKILGYKAQIDINTEVAIIGLDAATTGRMSIIYFREYKGESANDLIDRIEKWHKTSSWYIHKNKDVMFYGAPSPKDIALCAFGIEKGNFIEADKKILQNAVERIMPCITDGAKIPRDIVNALVKKCYCPEKYSMKYNWNKVLEVTCAMYKKYLYDYKGEEVVMSTDKNNNLAYNCGRLLAVADEIERYALKSKDSSRTTNAMRYFNSFSHNPCKVWGVITRKLATYIDMLGKSGDYLQNLLSQISKEIDSDEFQNVRNLDGRMALGFYTQKKEILDRIIEIKNNKETK